jgi:methylmalonyl-CoA mutase, N-terminal domain
MERRAEEVFAHLRDLGGGSMLEGVHAGIEEGWFVGEIADAAYRFARDVEDGRRVVVGVNAFTDGGDGAQAPTLRIDPAVEADQRRRLAAVRAARDPRRVETALAAVTAAAADPARNVMPSLIDAVRAHATLGEVVGALEAVFGTYVEPVVV